MSTGRWYRCTVCARPTRVEGLHVRGPDHCPLCGDGRLVACCASEVSPHETAAMIGMAKAADTSLAGDLCAEMAASCRVTEAIALAIGDGRVTPDEAASILMAIEERNRNEGPVVKALVSIARKGAK